MRYQILTALLGLMMTSAALGNTTITYQGRLDQSGQPASGTLDMVFELYDAASGGSMIGPSLTQSVDVDDGLFQVELDFGSVFDGDPRFLQISVNGDVLIPRQAVRAAPVALYALAGNQGPVGPPGASPFVLDPSTGMIEYLFDNQILRFQPDQNADFVRSPRVLIGHVANTALESGTVVAGGGTADRPNSAEREFAVVSGGAGNQASGLFSSVGGGEENQASSANSTVSGGFGNQAESFGSTVAGGRENRASGSGSQVGGGTRNVASGVDSVVGGGETNGATGDRSVVGGGFTNGASSLHSVVAGGVFNRASQTDGTVGGGFGNTASGIGSTVPGGNKNCAGGWYSWAGGLNAKVRPGSNSGDPGVGCEDVPIVSFDGDGDEGTFVWSDSQGTDFVSTGPDQFLIRANGNVGINTNAPTHTLSVNGNASKPGGGSWSVFSDSRLKQGIEPLASGGSVLDRLLRLEGYEFAYSELAIDNHLGLPGRQIGLLAQEVREVFPGWVASTDDGYLYVTERGTTALFIEALRELRAENDARYSRLQDEKDAQLSELRVELSTLRAQAERWQAMSRRNEALEARLATLEALLLEGTELAKASP